MKVCSEQLGLACIHSITTISLVRLLEMPRGRELNDEERAVIDALHNEGKSSRSIALVLNRDHSGISKYLKKRDVCVIFTRVSQFDVNLRKTVVYVLYVVKFEFEP